MTASIRPIQPRTIRLRNGLHFEFSEQGRSGVQTLLLLHGITDSWRSFEPVLPWLRSDWHVISLTMRGHGGSDKAAGAYRIRDFAEDVAAFAAELSLPPMTLVGHSMGAAVAMRVAIDRPGLVRSVVAAGAFARFSNKPSLVDFIHETISTMGDTVPRELADGFQRETIARPVAAGLIETMVDECLRTPAQVWRAAFAGLLEDDFSDEIDRIAAPVLLAWGDADAFVPELDQLQLVRGIRQAVRSVYRGVGHALHWEQPERFAAELGAFLDRFSSRESSVAAAAA